MEITARHITFVLVLAVASSAAGQGTPAPAAPIQHAQHTAPPGYDGAPLTLRAALDEALAGNPILAAARLELSAVRQRRATEGFLEPPTLEAEIWQWPLTSVNPLDTSMYMFTMRQAIPGRGKRAARAALVDKDVEGASNEIVVRAREVINQIRRAYADLFVSRQAVLVHQASVDLLRQAADLTTARYAAGHGSQLEVLRTIAEISKLHTDLVMLEERADLAALRLNTLLNRPPAAPIGDVAIAAIEGAVPSIDELQRIAIEQHPELRAAQVDVERAEAALDIAKRDVKPDFMVAGGYQLMARTAGAWTASVGMTWPNAPWSRGRLDAARAHAVANIAAARAHQAVVANAIASAVQDAYVRVNAARSRASLLRTSVIPQTEQLFEAVRVAYQSDRGEAAALIDNQRMLLDSKLDYYHTLSDLQQARADLERAVGTDLEATR